MGNQYHRLMMANDPNADPNERLGCLKELFESLIGKNIVTNEEITQIINHTSDVLEKHKDEISKLK